MRKREGENVLVRDKEREGGERMGNGGGAGYPLIDMLSP